MHNVYKLIREAFVQKNREDLGILAQQVLRLAYESSQKNEFYFHPLGFIYSVAHTFENNEAIRIHIWDKNLSTPQSGLNIHNHYYIVNSYIFCGCVVNKIFYEEQNAEHEFAIFTGSYSSNGERILNKTTETIHLSLKRVENHCAGMLYDIQTNEIHSGGALNNELTCTIVFTEKPGVPTPLVAGPLDSNAEYRFTKKAVSADDISILLLDLLNTKQ